VAERRASPVAEAGSGDSWPFDRDTAVRRIAQRAGAGAPGVPRGGAVAPARARFAAEVSPDWHAARGPHGGYVAAIVLRALSEAAGEERRAPRSLTVHYTRPARPGPVEIHTAVERRGRSLSTLSARMEQDGAPIALALAAFSVPWSAPEIAELPMPSVAPPDPERRTPQFVLERIEQGLAPPFLRRLVVQQRVGATPFAGDTAAMENGAWLGLAEAGRPLDALALAMFSDVGVPPPFTRLRARAMASTVDLTVHFRTRVPGADTGDPSVLCYAAQRTRLLHEGFFEVDGAIWAPDGTVLAQSRQLAILMPLDGR
jgi:acyl-CoA thioesterase